MIDGASSTLPHFVKDIKIQPASSGKGAIHLRVSKTTDGSLKQAIFAMVITVSAFQFTFVQIISAPGNVKQLLRTSVDSLSITRSIILVDEPKQPFDKLVHHSVRDANSLRGLTQSEVEAINRVLPPEDSVVYIPLIAMRDHSKDVVVLAPTGSGASLEPEPIVMATGHHFYVVNEGKVIIDCDFENIRTWPEATKAFVTQAA